MYLGKIIELKGEVPSAIDIPPGCRFHPRCPKAFDRCPLKEPVLLGIGKDHFVACHLYYTYLGNSAKILKLNLRDGGFIINICSH